jgi:hypothetical protein
MQSYDDQALALLKPRYEGRWDIWFVPRIGQRSTWCAKPAGTPTATINVETPEDLVRAIAEDERGVIIEFQAVRKWAQG